MYCINDHHVYCGPCPKSIQPSAKITSNDALFEKYSSIIQCLKKAQPRRLCSGKTLAFQAKDAGSIPARRSNFWD